MKFKFSVIIIIVLIVSCSKKEEKVTVIKEKNLETQMIEVYNQAMAEFERGDVLFAGKKFGEAELLYPQSIWAPRAVLMAAYGYFSQGYYSDAIKDLERFLVYLCIGVKLLILDTLSTYTYEIDLKNIHLNTPFLLVLNNSMRGGVNNFMPFRKQRLSKCCIFGDIFSKCMNLSIFKVRLI